MTRHKSHSPTAIRRDRGLPSEKIRRIYDRIGRWQDTQAFYEDTAIDKLIAQGNFESAHQVIEIGCGTGRLARRLIDSHLPPDATYLGIELSPRMAAITGDRFRAYAPRCVVKVADAATQWPHDITRADRVVATYLFDLLDNNDTAVLLDRAAQVLAPDGRLCTISLTHGRSGTARAVSNTWAAIWRHLPAVVGGCRPIRLADLLEQTGWRIEHTADMTAWGLTSEIVVAQPPLA